MVNYVGTRLDSLVFVAYIVRCKENICDDKRVQEGN